MGGRQMASRTTGPEVVFSFSSVPVLLFLSFRTPRFLLRSLRNHRVWRTFPYRDRFGGCPIRGLRGFRCASARPRRHHDARGESEWSTLPFPSADHLPFPENH